MTDRGRDYHLRITCTDKGTHAERELAVLVPVYPRVDLERMGGPRPEPSAEYAAALARGYGAAGGHRTFDGVREIIRSKAAVVLSTARDGRVIVHVPPCPTCGRAPRIAAEVLYRVCDALAGLHPEQTAAPQKTRARTLDVSVHLL